MEFWQKLLELMNSTSVLSVLIGVLVIAFARAIIRIFRMGVTFANELVSRDEFERFKAEVKQDMRAYATQIQRAVLESVMRVVDTKLKNVDTVSETANEMKLLKVEIENDVKNTLEKVDEIKGLSDNVRSLNNRVSRLEFGNDTKTERRKEG